MNKKYLIATTLMTALLIAAGCQQKPRVADLPTTGTESTTGTNQYSESTSSYREETGDYQGSTSSQQPSGQYHDTTRGTQGRYQPSTQDQMYNRENQPSSRQNPSGMQ